MSETGIAPTRRNEDEKICGDDGGADIKWRSTNGK